jgi:hypothetical protein
MRAIAVWISSLVAVSAGAAEAPAAPTRLDDFGWLAGHWVGEGLGGEVEELWAPARDGAMVGVFRLVEDGKVVFYELMTLREDEGQLSIRLKHFRPDLVGWEEKADSVSFPLLSREGDRFHFEGQVLEKKGPDHFDVDLTISGKDGTTRQERFVYRRVADAAGQSATGEEGNASR